MKVGSSISILRDHFLLILVMLAINLVQSQKTIATSKIAFEFVSKGVDGNISGFQSNSSIDLEDLSKSYFQGSVAVKTIRTGIFLRDWSLKGGKYFDEDSHPRITFESTAISKEGINLIVTGNLTIKGITKPITISFKREANSLVGLSSLYTSDFGINIKKQREDNKVLMFMNFDLK